MMLEIQALTSWEAPYTTSHFSKYQGPKVRSTSGTPRNFFYIYARSRPEDSKQQLDVALGSAVCKPTGVPITLPNSTCSFLIVCVPLHLFEYLIQKIPPEIKNLRKTKSISIHKWTVFQYLPQTQNLKEMRKRSYWKGTQNWNQSYFQGWWV